MRNFIRLAAAHQNRCNYGADFLASDLLELAPSIVICSDSIIIINIVVISIPWLACLIPEAPGPNHGSWVPKSSVNELFPYRRVCFGALWLLTVPGILSIKSTLISRPFFLTPRAPPTTTGIVS